MKTAQNVKKRKRSLETENTSKSNLFKPPTVEELNQLRETEILFNSNLFRLQTEELVKEVSIKEKRKRDVSVWIEKFEKFVGNLPEYESKGVMKQVVKNNPLDVEMDQNAPVKFIKPYCVETVGLYALNAAIGPEIRVRLNVTIPKCFFQAKDYLNARYIVKRALYLSYIATHLKMKESEFSKNCKFSWSYLNGTEMQPILQVIANDVKKIVFEILATPEDETFKLSRFKNDKSNVRLMYWNNLMGMEQSDDDQEISNTIWYNALISYDVNLRSRHKNAQEFLREMCGARDALRLLTVWLRQRSFHLSEDFLITLALASSSRINKHMSSYQAVRALFTHLSHGELPEASMLLMPAYEATMRHVQQEAVRALKLLDTADLNAFHTLFMIPRPPHLQYDALVDIYYTDELQRLYDALPISTKVGFLSCKWPVLLDHVVETLRAGLTDRVLSIVPVVMPAPNWEIGTKPPVPPPKPHPYIRIGMVFNIENMMRVVDKGPPAYDPQSAAFRNFWGEKAELRRFKDGSICEAVYWKAEYAREKRQICKNIVEFILEEKLQLVSGYNIVYDFADQVVDGQLEPIEESNMAVVTEFDALAKKLRDLQLPLSIASVAGISAAFSHSEVQPPVPQIYASSSSTYEYQDTVLFKDKKPLNIVSQQVAPVEAVIQMVQHSKWPSELTAMRALRGALFLQMSRELKRGGLTCRAFCDYVDVVNSGFVTRLEIFHPRELSLLPESESSSRELRCVLLPRLRGALSGLRAQCPAFPLAAVLARRWIRAQLMDVPEAVSELLVAASLEERAALPQRAFLLFLDLLARHPWKSQPLFLDVSGQLTAAQRETIDAEFRSSRNSFPPLCIITPCDLRSKISASNPTDPHLQRLILLAQRAFALLNQQQHDLNAELFAALFKPNMSGYNVLIHLRPQLNARRKQNQQTLAYDSALPNKMPIVNFNPVQIYVDQLKENYSDFAVFFYDIHGGNVIAVLWKPNVTEKIDFKVSQVAGMQLVTGEQTLKVNIEAIIEDFYILGEGLVENINVL